MWVNMLWSEYYEKINNWAVSTAVSKISSLEDMGAPDEIVDALVIIGFEDKKGATRLLNRALQHGVKFSGENLVEINDFCEEESFKKALYQSADAFTAQDLEDMYGCVDDELIIDLVKRYKLSAPADIAAKYEEELYPDTGTPISWSRFYDAFYDWKPEYAKARLQAVTGFGSNDEVLEVVRELFFNDEYGASKFITRAVDAGVQFRDEDLSELVQYCNEDIVVRVAKDQNLELPEYLQDEPDEEAEEQQDLEYEIECAIYAADYALECLVQAQSSMNDSRAASFWDMMTQGFLASYMKYSALSEADVDMQQVQNALNSLNAELQILQMNKIIQLKYGSLATAIDMWFDIGLTDVLTDIQISKAQKRITRAIKQVENIRRELRALL